MIIIRLLLHITCFVAITWTIIVFGGPHVIKRLIIAYTDSAVTPSNVRISPTFDISIGRLDFKIENPEAKLLVKGFSRSTQLSWSVLRRQPFLEVNFGPTIIHDVFIADEIKIESASYNKMDWEKLFFAVSAGSLELESGETFESLRLQGNLKLGVSKIDNIYFDANNVSLAGHSPSWSAGLISGDLTSFEFNSLLIDQVLSGNFSVIDVKLTDPNLTVAEANGELRIAEGSKSFKIDLDEVHLKDLDGYSKSIKINAEYGKNVLKELKVDLFHGALFKHFPNPLIISMMVASKSSEVYEVSIDGVLEKFEIFSDGNLLGLLPSNNFKILSEVDRSIGKLTAEAEISFSNTGNIVINGSSDVGLIVSGPLEFECLISSCDFDAFELDYQVSFDKDWVRGNAVCQEDMCNLESLKHTLISSDTATIVTLLNQIQVLTPLSALYIYGVAASGEKINKGHRLKF